MSSSPWVVGRAITGGSCASSRTSAVAGEDHNGAATRSQGDGDALGYLKDAGEVEWGRLLPVLGDRAVPDVDPDTVRAVERHTGSLHQGCGDAVLLQVGDCAVRQLADLGALVDPRQARAGWDQTRLGPDLDDQRHLRFGIAAAAVDARFDALPVRALRC